jgi:hypothetical protein
MLLQVSGQEADGSVQELGGQSTSVGGACIAHSAIWVRRENRRHGQKRPGLRHPDSSCAYFMEAALMFVELHGRWFVR